MEFDCSEIIQSQTVYFDACKEIKDIRRSEDADHFLPRPQIISIIDDTRHKNDQRAQKHDSRKTGTITQRNPKEKCAPISCKYGHASHSRRFLYMHFRFRRLIHPTETSRCCTEKVGEQRTCQNRRTEKKHKMYKKTHRIPPFTLYFLNHRRFRLYMQIGHLFQSAIR
ncbi:hypothetical protein SDC9_154347 [bioreactor metagenome]|uniref:Uncharacterized protein n=1 Tax=bioreactor metagenome TaxID=1076179 RepID=A0A645EYI4_9ZZZZ